MSSVNGTATEAAKLWDPPARSHTLSPKSFHTLNSVAATPDAVSLITPTDVIIFTPLIKRLLSSGHVQNIIFHVQFSVQFYVINCVLLKERINLSSAF